MRFGYGVTDEALLRLTRAVLEARAPEHTRLVDLVGVRPLDDDERETLRGILSDELVETGLGSGDEPNDRGRHLEAAITWLGHK